MQAMVLKKLKVPLEWTHLADRSPGRGEIRVKILACGVCRTDLHVVDGELCDPHVPIIPGSRALCPQGGAQGGGGSFAPASI
jgi:alcohol dehydrogenase, propanol-preferring